MILSEVQYLLKFVTIPQNQLETQAFRYKISNTSYRSCLEKESVWATWMAAGLIYRVGFQLVILYLKFSIPCTD